ncbi:MAG TPA: kelch repeat-containing protein [Pirellulaceae bacterium]|nr:kelch repeat-containing protein [Pirellulaceae bacterium]
MIRPLQRTLVAMLLLSAALLAPRPVAAHFVWLTIDPTAPDGTVVHVRLSESADTNEPQLLSRLAALSLHRMNADGSLTAIATERRNDQLVARLDAADDSIVCGEIGLGVMSRDNVAFRLDYFAVTGPRAGSPAWKTFAEKSTAKLTVIPTRDDRAIVLDVRYQGASAAGCQVVILDAAGVETTGETDADGRFRFEPANEGIASIRVRHVAEESGEANGSAYAQVRTYATLALPIGEPTSGDRTVAALPQVVTSFGGAIVDGQLYVYGGHTGEAHEYSHVDQDRVLRRLDLKQPEAQWESLGEGPALQGLALVPYGSSVIRVGGFNARNEPGDEHDLHSIDEVARFDEETGTWVALPSLPEARSSHDAIVLDNKLYVVGGWKMAGEGNTTWHATGWTLDLADDDAKWEPLEVPFRRRALALAAHDGDLYAIGGMGETGGPTTRVDRFDPETRTWSEVAPLEGEGMSGFGCAAFATGGRLYVSTIRGELQRLAEDGSRWETIRKLPKPRFFHRMLPMDDDHLVIVGGGSMELGKFDQVDIIAID